MGGPPELIFKAAAAVTVIVAETASLFVTVSVAASVWLPVPADSNVAERLLETPAASAVVGGSLAVESLLEN